MDCLNCGERTENPKFCSRSCGVSYNNKKSPKRKIQKICERSGCNLFVEYSGKRLCKEHSKDAKEKYKKFTIGSYRERLSVKGRHPSWLNSHVRNFARSWLKHLTEKPCTNCGYSLHVELCHIKSVSSFSDDSLLGDVNSEENVVPLCRNCHWEFDNGYLSLEAFRC